MQPGDIAVLFLIIASSLSLLTVMRALVLRYWAIQQMLRNQTEQIYQRSVRLVETNGDAPVQ